MTTIHVTQTLLDTQHASSAFVEAVQSVLVPGAMAIPGVLNLTILPRYDSPGKEGCIVPLPADVLDWLAVADMNLDEMPPLRFEIDIPGEYLRAAQLRAA